MTKTLAYGATYIFQLVDRYGSCRRDAVETLWETREYEHLGRLTYLAEQRVHPRQALRIRRAERVVHELVTELEKSQPLISQHLRVLRKAGLVSSSRNGREVLYALARPEVIDVIGELVELSLLDEARDDLAALRQRRNQRRNNETAAGAAIINPPIEVRPEIDPGLTPRTPKPRRD